MEFIIRNLHQEDIKKAAEVFYLSFNSVGEKWNRETAEKRLEQYFNPDSCWVAENDKEIVGVLTSKFDNVVDHQELYIDILAVDPKFHKSGIGSKLLQTAENYAKSKGFKSIWLTASSDLTSYLWYLKTGFKETSWKVLVKDFD
jgi:ribosomal protein S18 acetylase RimI-like enzyme